MPRMGYAADAGFWLGILVVADVVPFIMVPAMHRSGSSTSSGPKRRGGSVSDVRPAATATQEPEQDAPGNAGSRSVSIRTLGPGVPELSVREHKS